MLSSKLSRDLLSGDLGVACKGQGLRQKVSIEALFIAPT